MISCRLVAKLALSMPLLVATLPAVEADVPVAGVVVVIDDIDGGDGATVDGADISHVVVVLELIVLALEPTPVEPTTDWANG